MSNRASGFKIVSRRPDLIRLDAPTSVINPGGLITSHWNTLGGLPGNALSEVEQVGAGYRIRYEHGSIYMKNEGPTVWVYGDIFLKYEELDGPNSWLGFPTAEEAPFSEGGRVTTFENGAIYWWPDVGAIEVNDVVVHYTGLICWGEYDSDQLSDSDEPYVALGVISPAGNFATRSQVYDDVDGGESRPDLVELYRGKPYGIIITGMLMENDEDDPDKYKGAIGMAVRAVAAGVQGAIGTVPAVGPALAVIAGPALSAAVPAVTQELNKLFNDFFDLGDDHIGTATFNITAKQMVVLAARTNNSVERGIGFKLHSSLLTDGGASYKIYFGLVPA